MGARPSHPTGTWGAAIVALLLLASSFGIALGQESSDTGEMSVGVYPSGEAPDTAPDAPTGERAGAGPDPQAQRLPGTVTAWIWLPDILAGTPAQQQVPTYLIVRDDRGTSAGWSVLLTTSGEGGEWEPILLANRPETIVRILPPPGTSPMERGSIAVGGTLGRLAASVAILRAPQGEGAGVYVQTLTITWPIPGRAPGFVIIQLPSAP